MCILLPSIVSWLQSLALFCLLQHQLRFPNACNMSLPPLLTASFSQHLTEQMPTILCDSQLDKPKKQRRKPAIAEVKDEEDQNMPAAVPHDSGELGEQVELEPKAEDDGDGDEPVSDSDQEPEPEPEAEVTVKKRRAR